MPTNNPSQIDVSRMSRAVVPVLEACSQASEDARRVEPEAMAAIQAAGLSRLLTPERFGGSEAPVSTHVRSCTELARGCAAASWVHMVCGAHTFVVGRYPEACQEEVFGPTPDVLIPGALAPQGRAKRVAEGWELNGRWQFGSGVDHGPWVVLGAQTIDVEEHGVPAIHLVIPRADITIDDTWHTLGMRGTGSRDIVAEAVFVPEHRVMPTRELFRGDFEGHAGPLYRLPVMGALASMLAGNVVGIAQRGLDGFVGATRVREEVYTGTAKAQKASIQMRIAESLGEVELAQSLVDKNCELLDAAMHARRPPPSTGKQSPPSGGMQPTPPNSAAARPSACTPPQARARRTTATRCSAGSETSTRRVITRLSTLTECSRPGDAWPWDSRPGRRSSDAGACTLQHSCQA